MNQARTIAGDWYDGVIPDNAYLGDGAYVETAFCFHCFRSRRPDGFVLGRGSAIYQQTVLDTGPEAKIHVGEFTLLNSLRIICDEAVHIGSYCLFSWNVIIMDSRRVPLAPAQRAEVLRQAIDADFQWPDAPVEAQPVHVSDNVWIGFDTVVLPGTRIGTGSVIGARSVVVGEIPEYCVAAGNPARVIRSLDPPEESPVG